MSSSTTGERIGAIAVALLVVLSAFVTGIALTAAPVRAEETTDALTPGPIATPGTIEQPGVYTLVADIDLGGANVSAFEGKTGDVVIDGNGHTISNGASEGIHVLDQSALSNVVVRDLTITNVDTGISAMNVRDSTFADLTLSSNADAGLVLAGGRTANVTVERVTIADNAKGIFLREATSDVTIRDSTFSANHEVGVKLSGSSDDLLEGNVFRDHDGEKTIHVTSRSRNVEIRDNQILDSTSPEYAVQIGGESAGAVVVGNEIRGNDRGGLSVGPTDAEIRANVVVDNGETGLAIAGTGAVLEDNTVTGNQVGIWFTVGGASGATNVVRDNGEADVRSTEGAADVALTGLVLGDETTVDLLGASVDFDLHGVTAVLEAPEGAVPTGIGVETAVAAGGQVAFQFHYDEAAVDESALTVLRHDDTAWVGVPDATVDQSTDRVAVTTDRAGVLALFEGSVDMLAPHAVAGDDRTILLGDPTTFDGSASTDDEGIETYEWDFGDGADAGGRLAVRRRAGPPGATARNPGRALRGREQSRGERRRLAVRAGRRHRERSGAGRRPARGDPSHRPGRRHPGHPGRRVSVPRRRRGP